jgi:hypothetical protein
MFHRHFERCYNSITTTGEKEASTSRDDFRGTIARARADYGGTVAAQADVSPLSKPSEKIGQVNPKRPKSE